MTDPAGVGDAARYGATCRVRTEGLPMWRKLTKTGNSLALVLDKPLLDRGGIDASAPLEISTDGQVIALSALRARRRTARLKRVVADVHRRHSGAFRRLAES